jgi:hypothetical protein
VTPQTGFRRIPLCDLRVGQDLVWMEGRLELVEALGIYAPDPDRLATCPIRSDWRAIHVITKSGSFWAGEPPESKESERVVLP